MDVRGSPPDAEVVALVLAGDTEAFGIVIRRYEAALERADQLQLVERALADLSPDKREAFVLKHVEGLSYEEMAAVTGERIPTLKMRVHRAREALLKVLEDHT